jgi:hypothetical protein
MGRGRRDERRGTVRAGAARGVCGGDEPAGGGAAVWDRPADGGEELLAVPGVRIHPSPPPSLACSPTFWSSDEIGAWGAIHTSPWTRRMPPRRPERKSRATFSVRDFRGSICEPASILREPSTHPARARKGSSAGVSYRTSRARSCALQSGGSSILWVIARVVRSAGWRPSAIALTILGARNASRITRRT